MRPLEIGCENFLGFEEFKLSLKNLDPLTLVMGFNHDFSEPSANGAGKSSIWEAYYYALSGNTARRLETLHGKDAVIHEGAKYCIVWSETAISDGVLRIERYRGHPEHGTTTKLWLNGKDIRGRDVRETDATIEKLLGFKAELAQRTVMMHSRLTQSVSTVPSSMLKSITEQLLGIRNFDGLRTFTRERSVSVATETKSLEARIAEMGSRIADTNHQLEELISNQKAHKAQVEASRAEADARIRAAMNDHANAVNQESLAEAAAKSAEKKLAKLRTERQPQIEVRRKAEGELTKIKVKAEASLAIKKRYSLLKDICPECGQKVSRKHIDAKLADIDEEQNKLMSQLGEAKTALTDYDNEIVRLDKLMAEAEVKANDARRLLADTQRRVAILAERVAQEKRQAKELESDPYAKLIEQTRRNLAKLIVDKGKMEGQLTEAEDRLRYLQFWLHGFGPDGLRSFMLDGATPVLNRLANVYLDTLTDSTMGVTLNTVKPAKDGTYKDKFDIDVTNESGASILGGCSDGELACLDISLNLAMADMLDSRIPGGIGLLFLDQAADLVDSARAAKLVRLLRQKLDPAWCAEVGVRPKQNIMVVSHNPSVQDLIGSRLVVEKREGVCKIL